MPHRLITIPASHYCDKARWALERANIAFVEDGHAPLFHWRKTRPLGKKTVPCLVLQDGQVLGDSTDILHFADRDLPADQRLFPLEPDLRAEVERWESRLDDKAGPYARRIVYGYLLDRKQDTVRAVASAGVPRWEQLAFAAAFPVIANLMRKGMRIYPKRVADSTHKFALLMDEVADALGDRPFLVGDRFTAADLTWAALTSPVLVPAEYPTPLPAPDSVQGEFGEQVRAFRAHPAGQHALRMYRELRRVRV